MNGRIDVRNEANPFHDALAAWSRTNAARIRHPGLQRSYIVPMVSKALHIIALLQSCDEPLELNEICARTGYARTSVYRILRTLSAHGLLPDGNHGVYCFHKLERLDLAGD